VLTPDLLMRAYAAGLFPMAPSATSRRVEWFEPDERGILPLETFHVPRRLRRRLRGGAFTVTVDRDFAAVVAGCADRPETWINAEIRRAYAELHARGHAHSIEVREGGELVGGLYGVRLGAAFFGESMFSRRTDASKVALTHLAARLRAGGFALLDAQYPTPHLARFGCRTIGRRRYRRLLSRAIASAADFGALPEDAPAARVLAALDEPPAPAVAAGHATSPARPRT